MTETDSASTASKAYRRGQQAGLAGAAVGVALLSFVSLLGVEKALLAVVLAVAALRGGAGDLRVRRLGQTAVALALAYMAVLAFLLVTFQDQLWDLLRLLQRFG